MRETFFKSLDKENVMRLIDPATLQLCVHYLVSVSKQRLPKEIA